MKARALALLCVLAVPLFACDRRDDPSVPASSTGSSTPPGEAVDSGTDTAATSQSQATPGGPGLPEATEMTPPVPASQCSGKIGDELSDCLQQRNVGAPQATEQQIGPARTPPPATPPGDNKD